MSRTIPLSTARRLTFEDIHREYTRTISLEDLPTTGREVDIRNPFIDPFVDPDTGEIFEYIPGWDFQPDPITTSQEKHYDEHELRAIFGRQAERIYHKD